jgi:hypothetical protein
MGKRQSDRQRKAAGQPSLAMIDSKIAAWQSLSLNQLRDAWTEELGVPRLALRSRSVLAGELAWDLQASVFGDLDAATTRRLQEIAEHLERGEELPLGPRRNLPPGVVLTREWKGVVHSVSVTDSGFQHLGRTYKSLSDVARAITGTRWSGPRFFGLKKTAARARRPTP